MFCFMFVNTILRVCLQHGHLALHLVVGRLQVGVVLLEGGHLVLQLVLVRFQGGHVCLQRGYLGLESRDLRPQQRQGRLNIRGNASWRAICNKKTVRNFVYAKNNNNNTFLTCI